MRSPRDANRVTGIALTVLAVLAALVSHRAQAATAPTEAQEVAFYVTDELFLFLCWKNREQCMAFAQANHNDTAKACPHLFPEKNLNSMAGFLIRETGRRSGVAFAALEDCHAGLEYWQGKLCIDLPPYIPAERFKWCAYATEVPDMRVSKEDLRRLRRTPDRP